MPLRSLLHAVRKRLRALRRPPALPPALIGHSHAQCIFEAAEAQGVALRGWNFWFSPQPFVNSERTAFHPEITEALSQGVVFSVVGGAAHSILTMVTHPRPFDFVLPSHPDLPFAEGAEVVPFEAMRAVMADRTQEYLELIGLVRQAATGRVIHIHSPPPLEDSERVLQDVPWDYFQNLTRTVAPSALRWKCWRLHADLVEGYCAEHGMEMLDPPAEAVDERGFLRSEFYKDAMHVQTNYGALVLGQIRRAMTEPGRPARRA